MSFALRRDCLLRAAASLPMLVRGALGGRESSIGKPSLIGPGTARNRRIFSGHGREWPAGPRILTARPPPGREKHCARSFGRSLQRSRAALRNHARRACYDHDRMLWQSSNHAVNLLGKSPDDLREFMRALGEPAYRGDQIYHALYAERRFDLAAMSNLPAALRERLAREAVIALPQIVEQYRSSDGTVRYVLSLPASDSPAPGNGRKPATIETVFMPEENRQTICVSTPGRLRRGLPFLPDGYARADPQSDGGRNSWRSARRARR